MEMIENISVEDINYYDINMLFQNEERNGLATMAMVGTGCHVPSALDGAAGCGVCHDSSSPDGGESSAASKKNDSEGNRRKKFTDKLNALRAVVPKITKLDQQSTIKDAIDYIQKLREQKERLEAELKELESKMRKPGYDFEYGEEATKKKRIDQLHDLRGFRASPIEVHELRIDDMDEKTLLVILKCVKRADTIMKLCEVFENLRLKIITASMTTISGRLLTKTVFVEADEDEKDHVKIRIEKAIYDCSSALNHTCIPVL